MSISPLDAWTKECLGGLALRDWQLLSLNRTLALAQRSDYYRKRLPESAGSLEDIAKLPLMGESDIAEQDARLLCVSARDISRVVSMLTSGTAGKPKRIYFTEGDLELTLDFFARGLPTLVGPGESAAVMFPCGTTDGVGELICRGLLRIPARPVPYGPVVDFDDALLTLKKTGAESIIGMPGQILELFRRRRLAGGLRVKKVLLSADGIPEELADELRAGGWEVFRHYGMTETGLGCAIDCGAHEGYHIREKDLYLEIIDPDTGECLPDGRTGEIVFTTLTRTGMPLIRYRTGDMSAILPGACSCGCGLRRLSLSLARRRPLPKGKGGGYPG